LRTGWMALSLLPQPKTVKTLVGFFDFKEVDTIYISKRASARVKRTATLLAAELYRHHHLDYQVQTSPNVDDPHGCLITHHTRGGVFVPMALEKAQGYEMVAAGHTLALSAFDDGGFYAGTRTIRQLLQEGTRISALKIEDWPSVPLRVLHLDLQGLTPNMLSLKELVERAGLHKFNALLIEYGNRFPYQCLGEHVGPHALSADTLKEFLADVEDNGLEVIPMLPCVGGLEFILSLPAYRGLAEVADQPSQVCLANTKGEKLLREMYRELLAAHARSQYVHIGPGRTNQLGQHPSSKSAAGKAGLPGLLLQQVLKFARQIKSDGKTALIGEEALRDVSPELLKGLPKQTGVVYSAFEPNNGQFTDELLPHLDRYRAAGLRVLGASSVRGHSLASNVPHYRHAYDNMDWWVEAAETRGPILGHVAWGPARCGFYTTPVDPFPVVWPAWMYAAERCWAGMDSSRESFERRLLVGFYGLRPDASEVLLAHYGINEDHAAEAAIVLSNAKAHVRRNRDVLELLEALARLEDFGRERQRFTELIASLLPRLESGRADPAEVRRLRGHLPVWIREIDRQKEELTRLLLRRFHFSEVDEFVSDRLLIAERLIHYVQSILRRG
jgi:hypothetical protein